MNSELQQLKEQVNANYAIYSSKVEEYKLKREEYRRFQKQQDDLNLILAYFNKLVDSKRKETMDQVTGLVTYGLCQVLDNPNIKLVVQEKMQRNQKFYVLGVEKDGILTTDWSTASGGARDLIVLLLRVVFLAKTSNQKFIILDEPFVGLDAKARENLIQLLKEISDEYGVQFFIVSHIEDLNQAATNLFRMKQVVKSDGIKDVTVEQQKIGD